MAKTTILRDSTIPQSFKAAVEAAAPTFIDKVSGETFKVELMLSMNPVSHFCSSSDMFPNVFATIANVLSGKQFKCKCKSALVFNKPSGEIVAAAISDYDAEGDNYFYNITFDENDIKGIDKSHIVNFQDYVDEVDRLKFWEIFNHNLLTSYNYSISDEGMLYVITIQCFEVLYHWLDVNANADEPVSLTITGYIGKYEPMSEEEYLSKLKVVAIASVEVVKDIKKISIQLGEEMKSIAKGNNDLS